LNLVVEARLGNKPLSCPFFSLPTSPTKKTKNKTKQKKKPYRKIKQANKQQMGMMGYDGCVSNGLEKSNYIFQICIYLYMHISCNNRTFKNKISEVIKIP
jgi:hypothetical protein